MPAYRLTSRALRDLIEISDYLTQEASARTAIRIEDKLFELFDLLAQNSGIGHRRSDITDRDVRFHPMRPYMIVYEPGQTITIHAILHSAREISEILKGRIV